ncbi:MAG: thioredoxin domain-containing protein [Bryobacteraceae bacterium]
MYTNALIDEKSPYLRQHAQNPVQWLPWGSAAFEKSKREDKPIFLSVGYSTCHWCHVMAHESFEDPNTAEVLNRYFVPVKVDREERPDVDRIYMLFVQATTGSGGWPMSVWLTPELKPFFGGTYFPPDNRYGRPGFRDLLQHLARVWHEDRPSIESSSANVTEQLRSIAAGRNSAQTLDKQLFESAYWHFRRSFDAQWGGFGGAPKFPRPAALLYLLRYGYGEKNEDAFEMVARTLRAMAAGGMNDHLGGGFHRYSVDERWFVPHFEKMLYDQAQLAMAYLEAFQMTRENVFAETAERTLRYVLRDLRDAEGGFYSGEDADSTDPENPKAHREGAFYVWRKREIDEVLGPDAENFSRHYGVQADGNVENDPHGEFPGFNILFEELPAADQDHSSIPSSTDNWQSSREKLFLRREQRPRPHLDNKVLTSWNALMISALAKGAGILDNPEYMNAGRKALDFLLSRMFDEQSGTLLRRYCEGEAAIPGFADDHAFLAAALLDVFEASGEARYLALALRLATEGLGQFEDTTQGGFFSTREGSEDILLRIKDDYDGAEPSANSIAIDALLRLAYWTERDDLYQRAERALLFFASRVHAQPTMAPQLLSALGRYLMPPEQIVIRCQDGAAHDATVAAVARTSRSEYRPYSAVVVLSDSESKALAKLAPTLSSLDRKEAATLYHCRNLACELPQTLA